MKFSNTIKTVLKIYQKYVKNSVWFGTGALTFTPGETQDDPRRLRIAIDLPEFRRIPKAGHITDYSKAESTGVRYEVQRCVTPQLNLLLIRFVAFHYDMKLIYCRVLFLKRF